MNETQQWKSTFSYASYKVSELHVNSLTLSSATVQPEHAHANTREMPYGESNRQVRLQNFSKTIRFLNRKNRHNPAYVSS